MEDGSDNTFMRKLDSTATEQESMRLSLGANLLQMLQFNQKASQKNRRVRNFNFRCNLQEIDKIIEEDLQENAPTQEAANPCVIAQGLDATLNQHASAEVLQEATLRGSIKAKKALRRKAWGVVNPRKSLRGGRRTSKERPRTAGMQLNSGSRPKEEEEDPILALLRGEADGKEQEEGDKSMVDEACK